MNHFHPDPKPVSIPKKKKGLNRSSIKKKVPKPTGELELFKKIYQERGGICCITKQPVIFHVESFMHVLSKGAYPSFRLEKLNILLVQREIHKLYDNEGKEKLLAKFPKASIIYEIKQMLKERYQWYADNKKFRGA